LPLEPFRLSGAKPQFAQIGLTLSDCCGGVVARRDFSYPSLRLKARASVPGSGQWSAARAARARPRCRWCRRRSRPAAAGARPQRRPSPGS